MGIHAGLAAPAVAFDRERRLHVRYDLVRRVLQETVSPARRRLLRRRLGDAVDEASSATGGPRQAAAG